MAAFLQRLPLPRLVHFLDMILPQMVPVQSPCDSGRRRFASSYRIAERLAGGEHGVEYPLNVVKLYWSIRSLWLKCRLGSNPRGQVVVVSTPDTTL